MRITYRHGIALMAVVAAATLCLALDPILGSAQTLLVFTLGILAAARFGGREPAILATILTVAVARFFFFDPRYTFAVKQPATAAGLVLLALVGVGISLTAIPAGKPDLIKEHTNAPFLRRMALLGTAFALLAAVTRILYADFERERDTRYWVSHTNEVLNQFQFLTSTLEQAETAQRGYLLTGEPRYLELFQSALRNEQTTIRSLLRLTVDNSDQQKRIATLNGLVDRRLASLRLTIEVRQSAGLAAAVERVRSGDGDRIMEQCLAALHDAQHVEIELLASRAASAEAQGLTTRWVLGLGSGSLLIMLVIAGAVIERDVQRRERDQIAVQRSEESLHLALESANAGTWRWDLTTNENEWSDELWKLYGLDPQSCAPSFEAWRNVVHPDDREEAVRVVAEAARAGVELNVEFRVRDPQGGERWLLARARPQRDSKGQAKSYAGIALDITQRKKAEEALREREQNLRRLTDAAPVAIALFDREMRYLAASQRFRSDYGVSNRELVGHSHYQIFPEIPEHWREIHRRCLAGAVERNAGERFERPDGRVQWVRWEIQPWYQPSGEVGGIVLFSEDLTEQRRVDQALVESETQFRALANAIPQLCWMAKADGWIFWYNQRWYDYTGTTPEQMEGWGWQSVHDSRVLPNVMDRWKTSIETGEPFEMVYPLRAANGEFHPFLTRIVPVRGGDGKVAQWFGTNTDITAQLATESALRQVSEYRRLAMEAAGLGSWEYRYRTGDVAWDDRCRVMFGAAQELGGLYEASLDRIHVEDRTHVVRAMQDAVAGVRGGVYHSEFRVVWPDSSVHWISSHGKVHVQGEEGSDREASMIGVAMDVTEGNRSELEIRQLNAELEERVRKRTAELETANRELEAFSYSVSHDLRAPLRGIDGWSLALAEDYADRLDERAHQYLVRVRSETQRMGLLIDDMLKLSRVSSTEMRLVPVDLSAIVGRIAADLSDAHPERCIEFITQPNVTVAGDPQLLEIALTNLLSNAVKFTGPRQMARVEFGLCQQNGEPVFSVRDNGVGFDMKYAGTLFGAFQRLHRTSEFPGTGIGLAIVQRVVHRHLGRVWAHALPDRGATFFFTIGTAA
jgi:PAS domain S-box-containing protein